MGFLLASSTAARCHPHDRTLAHLSIYQVPFLSFSSSFLPVIAYSGFDSGKLVLHPFSLSTTTLICLSPWSSLSLSLSLARSLSFSLAHNYCTALHCTARNQRPGLAWPGLCLDLLFWPRRDATWRLRPPGRSERLLIVCVVYGFD